MSHEMLKSYNLKTMSVESLWYHWSVYGEHDAAIEICDRAIADEESPAMKYAKIIWRKQ